MAGGSAVAGFLASRFMKATSRDRYAKIGGYPSRTEAGADTRRAVATTNATRELPTGGNGSGLD
jgi:hypothetical protein